MFLPGEERWLVTPGASGRERLVAELVRVLWVYSIQICLDKEAGLGVRPSPSPGSCAQPDRWNPDDRRGWPPEGSKTQTKNEK